MKKIAVFTLALLAAMPLAAQKRAFTIEDIYRLQYASGPTVSATGALAYGTSRSDLKAQKSYSNIVVNGKTITTDNKSFSPFWSADGRTLYYVSMASGSSQLYAWRDGKANKAAIERKAKNPIQAHIADHLLYRHWTEYSDGKYWHIIVYNLKDKTYTDVTPGRFHSPVFSPSGPSGFVFSPDSKELCYLSNHDEHPEATTNCDLWVVPVTGGEAKNITAENKAWDGSPQYSPDGRYIAYRFQRTPGYESDRFILGLYDRKTGQKGPSIENGKEALSLLAALDMEKTITAGTTYVNLATAHGAFGEHEEAIRLFEKARAVYEDTRHIAPQLLGGLYNNMALTCTELGRFDEALALYEKAVGLMGQVQDGELEQAITYLNMANTVEARDGLQAGEAKINELVERAETLLMDKGEALLGDKEAMLHDGTDLRTLKLEERARLGYYAFVCEKCAPTFAYYGYFITAEALAARSEELVKRV